VVQSYERLGDKFIFYSLGNFVFDTDYQRQQNYSENGVLLKLRFDETAFTWEYLATKVNREKQTVERTEAPTVFCDVHGRNYRLLWPLAAKKFLQNYKVSKTFVLPKAKGYNRRQ
jgi:poly-gamma-glutamate synthesis protein (capsule biosynthesis protein)